MSLSLSKKVLLLFSSLTAMTLMLGVAAYIGFNKYSNHIVLISELKDFQLSIERLKVEQARLSHSGAAENLATFRKEIAQSKRLADKIIIRMGGVDNRQQARLLKIPFYLDNYQQAGGELINRISAENDLINHNLKLTKDIREACQQIPQRAGNCIDLVNNLFPVQFRLHHQRDLSVLPELKNRQQSVQGLGKSQAVQDLLDLFLSNLEKEYLNYLAILDRKAFLDKTAGHFFRVTDAILAKLYENNRKDHHLLVGAVVFMSIAVLLMNLLFWALAQRYFDRFIHTQKKAIQAVKEGMYPFNLDKPADDEIGDLTNAMNELSYSLAESENKYSTMMASMENPAYICSPDLIIEYMNPAMIEMVGKDATGEQCYKALHDFEQECSWCLRDEIQSQISAEHEVFIPKKNKTFKVSSSPLIHKDGTISKMSVYYDITHIKEMNTRLAQAQKMESIGNLAGGIAHDFNNILFPIVGMAELLLEDLPSQSPEHQKIKEIYKAGKRGSELVNQILAFSRQSEQKKIPVHIQQILREVMKLTRASIPSNIQITQDIQTNCHMVLAQPTQIHQVAMNLITNAYHAVEPKNGRIVVRLEEIELERDDLPDSNLLPGRYARLTVSDTGEGISPAILNNIFEPYFTTKDQSKGTGLGLSVVFGIVKEHYGDITVYSELGKGTTFNVYFPVLAQDEKPALIDQAQTMATGSERILLVDDEEAVVSLEKQMLERLGYTVIACTSSTEALKRFNANSSQFDLVVSDMAMPSMTGDQLARELASTRPDIPIIICTGFSERINRKNAASFGVKGLLMKPIVKSELANMVRKVLDETQVSR